MHKLFFENLNPGTLLFSRFILQGCTYANDEGGIYVCADTAQCGRKIVLKILSRHSVHSEEVAKRLFRELSFSQRVKHPNVQRGLEFFADDDFAAFSMEFVEGGSLAQQLERQRPLSFYRLMKILRQLCAGLEAIHAVGICHRDLKPENILLSATDEVRITDFGISAFLSSDLQGDYDDSLSGSLNYLSPEYVLEGRFDARSDIYSLGVLAYELIAGRLPFVGKNMIETLSARLRDEAPPLHALAVKTPRPLSYAIMRAMHREPNKRFSSILEFRDALDFVRLPNGLPCAL